MKLCSLQERRRTRKSAASIRCPPSIRKGTSRGRIPTLTHVGFLKGRETSPLSPPGPAVMLQLSVGPHSAEAPVIRRESTEKTASPAEPAAHGRQYYVDVTQPRSTVSDRINAKASVKLSTQGSWPSGSTPRVCVSSWLGHSHPHPSLRVRIVPLFSPSRFHAAFS